MKIFSEAKVTSLCNDGHILVLTSSSPSNRQKVKVGKEERRIQRHLVRTLGKRKDKNETWPEFRAEGGDSDNRAGLGKSSRSSSS